MIENSYSANVQKEGLKSRGEESASAASLQSPVLFRPPGNRPFAVHPSHLPLDSGHLAVDDQMHLENEMPDKWQGRLQNFDSTQEGMRLGISPDMSPANSSKVTPLHKTTVMMNFTNRSKMMPNVHLKRASP